MMYIPLLKTIECLLQRDSIVDEVGIVLAHIQYVLKVCFKLNMHHVIVVCDYILIKRFPHTD